MSTEDAPTDIIGAIKNWLNLGLSMSRTSQHIFDCRHTAVRMPAHTPRSIFQSFAVTRKNGVPLCQWQSVMFCTSG